MALDEINLINTKVSEKITVSNDAAGKGFTSATMDTVYSVHGEQLAGVTFSVEDADVRYKIGTAPTATDGILLKADDTLAFTSEEEAREVLFIRTAAVDAVINAVFLKA